LPISASALPTAGRARRRIAGRSWPVPGTNTWEQPVCFSAPPPEGRGTVFRQTDLFHLTFSDIRVGIVLGDGANSLVIELAITVALDTNQLPILDWIVVGVEGKVATDTFEISFAKSFAEGIRIALEIAVYGLERRTNETSRVIRSGRIHRRTAIVFFFECSYKIFAGFVVLLAGPLSGQVIALACITRGGQHTIVHRIQGGNHFDGFVQAGVRKLLGEVDAGTAGQELEHRVRLQRANTGQLN